MSKKKVFALRLDPEVLTALEKWAADEFRSVNGQIEWILVRSLRKDGRYKTNDNQTNQKYLGEDSQGQ